MKREYDFSKAKRAKQVPHLAALQAKEAAGKTRITIMVDNDVLASFRDLATEHGTRYQTEINQALRKLIKKNAPATILEIEDALHTALKEQTKKLAKLVENLHHEHETHER